MLIDLQELYLSFKRGEESAPHIAFNLLLFGNDGRLETFKNGINDTLLSQATNIARDAREEYEQHLKNMRKILCGLNINEQSDSKYTLYRGVLYGNGDRIRCEISENGKSYEAAGQPLSFAHDEGTAIGEARRDTRRGTKGCLAYRKAFEIDEIRFAETITYDSLPESEIIVLSKEHTIEISKEDVYFAEPKLK